MNTLFSAILKRNLKEEVLTIDGNLKYIPFVAISNSKKIGITSNDELVLLENNKVYSIKTSKDYFHFVVLFEESYELFHKRIECKLNKSMIDKFIRLLSIKNIIIGAFFSNSNYWATLSLDWFDILSETDKKEVIQNISYVEQAKWASQKLRHKYKKLKLNLIKRNLGV